MKVSAFILSLVISSSGGWTDKDTADASSPEVKRWSSARGEKVVPALKYCVIKAGAKIRLIDKYEDHIEYTSTDSQDEKIEACMRDKGFTVRVERFPVKPGSKITYINR